METADDSQPSLSRGLGSQDDPEPCAPVYASKICQLGSIRESPEFRGRWLLVPKIEIAAFYSMQREVRFLEMRVGALHLLLAFVEQSEDTWFGKDFLLLVCAST